MEIYKNGKEAFKEILTQIEKAKESIFINMFIWRDDEIGCRMANAVLDAADRGVKCNLSIDRVGAVFEYAEESGRSLFHKRTDLSEKIKILVLSSGYNNKQTKKGEEHYELYERLISHPNIVVEKDVKKHDHSKFYIFDNETLILGGINIEDKENGKDSRGYEYQDYMVKIVGKTYVEAFLRKRKDKINVMQDPLFLLNVKQPERYFEIKDYYIKLINECTTSLTIVMAYFSHVKPILKQLLNAVDRGVKVDIMISASANFQDDANKKSVKALLKKSKGKINVYLSPFMLHTKLMIADDTVCLGSCNIAKQSFYVLDELNVATKDGYIYETVLKDVKNNFSTAKKVLSYKDIKYNRFIAFIEGLIA